MSDSQKNKITKILNKANLQNLCPSKICTYTVLIALFEMDWVKCYKIQSGSQEMAVMVAQWQQNLSIKCYLFSNVSTKFT